MKHKSKKLTISIFSIIALISCDSPTWKQRGFESETAYNEHINDSIEYQKWKKDDKKFIGRWEQSKSGAFGTSQDFLLDIMPNGHGKFTEEQGVMYMRDASFRWSKVDDLSIKISNLYGPNEYGDGPRFQRYNGIYKISDSADFIEHTNLKESFDKEITFK